MVNLEIDCPYPLQTRTWCLWSSSSHVPPRVLYQRYKARPFALWAGAGHLRWVLSSPMGSAAGAQPLLHLDFSLCLILLLLLPSIGIDPKHSLINTLISIFEFPSWRPNCDIYYFLKQAQNKTGPTQWQMNDLWYPQNFKGHKLLGVCSSWRK